MTFYSDIRDDVAGPLVRQFGVDVVLRQTSDSYYPEEGANVSSVTATLTVRAVILPIRRVGSTQPPEFRAEDIVKMERVALVDASPLATAGVSPRAGDTLVIAGVPHAVVAVVAVAPGGVPVLFKLGVAGA